MHRYVPATIALCLSLPAFAGSYDDNLAVSMMKSKPCGSVTKALDDAAIRVPSDVFEEQQWVEMAEGMAMQGMVWGMILGFDQAHGGLWDGEKSTLERFKAECSAHPTESGMAILNRLSR